MDEKRFEERAAITLKVDYKRLNTFFADYTKNISKGGTFIRTTKPLESGTVFVFVLHLPSVEQQIELVGEVMWVVNEAEATEEQPPGMGIKFRFQDKSEEAKVAGFVEKLMHETLGEHISQKLLGQTK